MLHMNFVFDWPSVSEKKMFKYYGHTHVYSPRAGADNPLGPNIFINMNILSICSFLASFLPLNDIFLFFPIQMHGRPKLTLP